jgi:hypothetical protein
MKQLFFIIALTGSVDLSAQVNDSHVYEFKRGKSVLLYSYMQKNDSCFIYGHLKERKAHRPILNVNITVKDFRIGTVPDRAGNFRLFLPATKGIIVFDKTGYTYFEFPYEYKRQDLKKPSAHH